MSTYYYMICDDHKERCEAASRTAGGYCDLADSDKTLVPFIIKHASCKVRIINEHNESAYSGDFEAWTEDNVTEMYERNENGQK